MFQILAGKLSVGIVQRVVDAEMGIENHSVLTNAEHEVGARSSGVDGTPGVVWVRVCVELHWRSTGAAVHDPEERERLAMDERGRSLWVKVGPADLDRQGVSRGVRIVVIAAPRDDRGEDEQQRELST